MKGFVATTIKYIIFFFNFTFVILGSLSIIYGALTLGMASQVKAEILIIHRAPALISVFIGVVICVICFFGCCGALRENYCMLSTFAAVTFLLLVIEFSVAGVLYSYRDKVEGLTQSAFTELINRYPNSTDVQDAINDLQISFKCCGGQGPRDWLKEPNEENHPTIPSSCCQEKATTCDEKLAYQQGCIIALKESLGKIFGTLAVIGITFGFFQLLGVLFSSCLAFAIRRNYDNV